MTERDNLNAIISRNCCNYNNCIPDCGKCNHISLSDKDIENLTDHLIANKCKALPCDIGDTVYTNCRMQGWYFREKDKPYKAKIVFIGLNGVDNFMNVDFGDGHMLQFPFSQIGKTLFLTEEEALKARNEHV